MLRITHFSLLLLASLLMTASADAQVACSSGDCGCQSQANSNGCTASLSDCGNQGAFFAQGESCGSCDCGANSRGNGCGANCCGSCGGASNIMGRLKGLLPMQGDESGCRYIGVFGGWSDLGDYSGNVGGPITGTFNDGFVLGVARGTYVTEKTRFEIENSWRNNTGDEWDNFLGNTQFDGQFNTFSTMFNTVREFGSSRVKPYAGAGIGLTVHDGDFDVNGNHFRFDDWRFAYQAIAGLNVTQSDNVDLFCEYRYLGNTDAGIENTAGVRVDEFSYLSKSIVFGFRFKR